MQVTAGVLERMLLAGSIPRVGWCMLSWRRWSERLVAGTLKEHCLDERLSGGGVDVGQRSGDVGARRVVSAVVCAWVFAGPAVAGVGREAGCGERRRRDSLGQGARARKPCERSSRIGPCFGWLSRRCAAAGRGSAVAFGSSSWRAVGMCGVDRTPERGAWGDRIASWAHVEYGEPGQGPGVADAGAGAARVVDGGMWQ